MTGVAGRLLTDLHPNGKVRLVFLQHSGGGCERPLIAQNLDMAEKEFINTLGLPPEKSVALCAKWERNKIADTVISVDAMVASTFRNHPLRME